MVTMAFRAGLYVSICARCASSTSVAERWPARMAAANCVVLEKTISFMIAPAYVCESSGLLLLVGFSPVFSSMSLFDRLIVDALARRSVLRWISPLPYACMRESPAGHVTIIADGTAKNFFYPTLFERLFALAFTARAVSS